MAAQRWEVRAAFGALLKAEFEGAGRLAKTVYPYTVKDFGARMPVLVLGSGGTEQKPFTARGSRPSYLLDLWSFVLYAEVAASTEAGQEGAALLVLDAATNLPVWDERASEEMLDRIEAGLRDLLDRNQRGNAWQSVAYAQPTVTEILQVGDQTYRREYFSLRFETF